MLEVTKTDLLRCENLVKAVKRGEFKLEGEEVMALSQSIAWAANLHERIKIALEGPKPPVENTVAPIKPSPKKGK
jgi:hypothetical protein